MPMLARQDTLYQKKTYTAREIITPPEIDGLINDGAWEKASWI
jgi:hypothetical protein